MSKKILKNTNMNSVLLENYENKKYAPESPVLGKFKIEITDDQVINQNGRYYSREVWEAPDAFGVGGKYLNEQGKLKPSQLIGYLDHPTENTNEVRLEDAAIIWTDIKREDSGKWFGEANILNNHKGKLIKTLLDYIKQFGGGEMIGVSTRALGDSVMVESVQGEYYEEIIADGFDVLAIDFVYNPSIATANNPQLMESKRSKKTLNESIQRLMKEDTEHEEYYKQFIVSKEVKAEGMDLTNKITDKYIAELKEEKHNIYNEIYNLEKMNDEDFANSKYGDKYKKEEIIKIFKDYHDGLDKKIKKEEVVDEVKTENTKVPPRAYDYNILSRMQADVKYMLGHGGRGAERYLWMNGNVEEHIAEMYRRLYAMDEEFRPEWLTIDDVKRYEKELLDLKYKQETNNETLEEAKVLTEETNEEEKHDEEVDNTDEGKETADDVETNEDDNKEDEEDNEDDETNEEEEHEDEEEDKTEATLENVMEEIRGLKEMIEALVGPLEPAELVIEDEVEIEGPELIPLDDMTDEELEDLLMLAGDEGDFI